MHTGVQALPVQVATRYVAPLREGGSLPGLMEADDLGTYVMKFHGAGQGPKVLVAEVICAPLARAVGHADLARLMRTVVYQAFG